MWEGNTKVSPVNRFNPGMGGRPLLRIKQSEIYTFTVGGGSDWQTDSTLEANGKWRASWGQFRLSARLPGINACHYSDRAWDDSHWVWRKVQCVIMQMVHVVPVERSAQEIMAWLFDWQEFHEKWLSPYHSSLSSESEVFHVRNVGLSRRTRHPC